MGRSSAAQKARTHEEILQHASKSFRARGSGVGINDMMRELGLTHGGFYRHFASKDELFVDAVGASFAELGERMERAAEQAPKGRELEAIISTYLSSRHVVHPEAGCTLAALSSDISRQTLPVRKKLDSILKIHMARMSQYLPGETAEERRKNCLILFSGMAGAVIMTRSFTDGRMRDDVLNLNREFYLKTFCGRQKGNG